MFNIEVISFLISEFINIIIIILFILVGGVLPLFERKFLSLTQRRIGPKYVGYKGRLQFIADSIKVLCKEYLSLYDVNSFLFFLTPVIFFNVNLIIWLNIVWVGNVVLVDIEYTLVYFLVISSLSHLFMFIAGIVSKNTYTIIASSRIANLTFLSELSIIILTTIIVLLNNSFSIVMFGINYKSTLLFLPILGPIFLIFLLDNGKTPFDLVEAETEIIMGYHVEYSGFLFGLFVLCEYLHVFFFIYILTNLVF